MTDRPLVIDYVSTETLIPYARNARTHSDEQVAMIAASIREYGWTNPILVWGENNIVAGHGRVLAARRLGMTEIPVIRLDHMTDAQRRAYVIADNQLALQAGWDKDLLALEVADLNRLAELGQIRIDTLGFGDEDLKRLLALADRTAAGETDPDEVPEPTGTPVSLIGDVWILGKHRLICGDATDELAVSLLLGSAKPDLMVTDPPYGVDYDPEWRKKAGINNSDRMGRVDNDSRADWREAWALFPGDVAYVWHGALHASAVAESLVATGFRIRSQIIWAKTSLVIGRGDYHWQHEPCWYAVRAKGTGHWAGDRKQSTLWHIPSKSQDAETVHSTQKPVECMRRPIENNSNPGQIVYEPFSGSGTTIIAAEMTGRICYAVELNPVYVDVAVTRWQNFTGATAYHEATGSTFVEMMAARNIGQPVTVKVAKPRRGRAST